jgi:hypothetical protein
MKNSQAWLEDLYHRIFDRRFPGATVEPAPGKKGCCIVNCPLPEPHHGDRRVQPFWITIDPFVFGVLTQADAGYAQRIRANIEGLLAVHLLRYDPKAPREDVVAIDIDLMALDE